MTQTIPAHACSVWLAADKLHISFPGTGPEGFSHSIELPANETGTWVLLKIMQDRARENHRGVGTGAAPTQWNIEHDNVYHRMLSAIKADKQQKLAEQAAARSELADLGL